MNANSNLYPTIIEIQTPIHHSRSYSAECGDTDNLSSSQIIPRIRTIQSECTIADEQKKHKKRRRRKAVDETSGYSTTSLSELSEFESPRQKAGRNKLYHPNHARQESTEDDRSERSRVSKESQATSRRGSEASKATVQNNNKITKGPTDRTKRDSPYHRKDQYRNSPQRPPSRARSTASLQSEISVKSNQSAQSKQSRRSSTQFRTDRPSDERFDPFAFIQPVPEPFSRKVKKTLGPIFGILLLLILAASLGAAIYFAVELKKNQDTEIEMLRASLNMKIKNNRLGKSLDELTPSDFKSLALAYCQQMDDYYRNSHFQKTYRGCELVSIKNERINFTLFFIENAASKKDIISVIETSAPKVQDNGENANVALVDKFEIELENAKIKIEHERTPVNFNKIITTTTSTTTTTTTTTRKPTTKMKTTTEITKATTKLKTTLPITTLKTTETSSILTTTTTKETTTKVLKTTVTTPVTAVKTTSGWDAGWSEDDILFAWEPCYMSGGNFYPYPTDCNKYFQCEHSVSLVRSCDGDTVFDVNSNVCVPHRPGVVCPDPALAPPKPPGQEPETTTNTPSINSTTTASSPKIHTKRLTRPIYPARPEYEKEPCVKADEGTLHAHPEDCSKFIQCISGNSGVVLTCAKNLVYDPETSSCIFPRNELICPDILPCLGKNNGYFSHPFNCSLYIQCQSGREVIQQCSPGLVWDPSVNSCVFHTANAACSEATKKN
ncbi:Hypothetical predicted protein [Mytilus galloprovincialis]|uniref:Chitin-binding type-2 domain-containing protein n=1 Tax=Mytilus galloprovincialis TaxID=29158 RepID=A0A8B6FXG6_MYTGA|nr:Hypothetical predicted protein [Mytilus galloprovincialis]